MKDLFGNPLPEPAALRKDGRLRRRGYSSRPGKPKGQNAGDEARRQKTNSP